MDCYPEILLPRRAYPILENKDVADNALVRETMTDVYPFLEKTGYEPDDILPFVIAPQPSLRELFELSIFLYGYYEEIHTLSFSHKPTRVNYWHFELWVNDSAGNHIPRDKSSARTKYLAKSILEYIIAEAVLFKASVKTFRRADFE